MNFKHTLGFLVAKIHAFFNFVFPFTKKFPFMNMQYNLSYWEQNTFLSKIDVLVIGSGIVGLSTAVYLKERRPGLKVVVLERGVLPIGASTRNAGFACFGSMTELLSDLENQTEDQVWSLVERRWQGLQQLRKMLGDKSMDFQQQGGYELFLEKDQPEFSKCSDAIARFNKNLVAITGQKELLSVANKEIKTFGFQQVRQMILNRAEGQIDTGKMMKALLSLARQNGVEILNGISVEQLEYSHSGVEIITSLGWEIKAHKVIVATNGFVRKLLPDLDVRPARNQVLITKAVPGLSIKGCFHYEQGYYYFRNIHGKVLLGGGRNLDLEGEETEELGTTQPIQNKLMDMLHSCILPGKVVEIDRWWTGILGLGDRKLPLVKKMHPNVVLAVRLGGMGIAIGNLVGKEAALLALDS